MAMPAASASSAPRSAPGGRDHAFHAVTVKRVVVETPDAASLVLDVPDELRAGFDHEPGQFCTFRVTVDGETHHRCYSMSSTPGIDDELQVTVKRVPGGVVSNWLLDHMEDGATVEVTYPAGAFRLAPDDGEVVAFVAGSGITPVYSMVKSALASTVRPVRVLYANRDADSVIFASGLADLATRHPDRLEVVHHLDVERGFVDADAVRAFLDGAPPATAGFYLCGPAPFMDVVEGALLDAGVDPSRIHIERFSPPTPDVVEPVASEVPAEVTIELDGRTATTTHHAGTTLLQTARSAGLKPPSSCEAGHCATCMGRLREGTVTMHANDALTDEEVEEGWVLTCQAVPTSPTVHVVYGYEGA